MLWSFIMVLVLVVVAFVIAIGFELVERARSRRLLNRPCAGIRWHRRFLTVPHDDIREFLSLFTEAFAFNQIHRCKFAPDDQPLAIYEARYVPHLTIDDHGEFESLGDALKSHYGIHLASVWRDDITLGELFALTRKSSQP